jgi:signal transduction histidine kinase
MRLTALYGFLFLASGAGLLAITNLLFRHAISTKHVYLQNGDTLPGAAGPSPAPGPGAGPIGDLALRKQQDLDLDQLVMQSGIALAVMALASVLLGWIVAGRVLRPLRTITAAARDISATNLHRRLDLTGPDDELRRLGETFDALLERLERSFVSQRRFVANASHELRTPLTRQRALIQVALSDPRATTDSLRTAHERALAANRRQEALIDALLVLARSDAGLERREVFDLEQVARHVVAARHEEASERRVEFRTSLAPAPCVGEPRLVERLIVNLADNALRYNIHGGTIEVSTGMRDSDALLRVENTGPVVPAEDVERLFQPFQRLGGARTAQDSGLGLGLSIVKAITTAHGGEAEVRPREEGGLRIEVRLPGA